MQRLPCWDLQTPGKRNWNMLEPNLDVLAFKYNHCSLKIKMKFKMYPKPPTGNRKKNKLLFLTLVPVNPTHVWTLEFHYRA